MSQHAGVVKTSHTAGLRENMSQHARVVKTRHCRAEGGHAITCKSDENHTCDENHTHCKAEGGCVSKYTGENHRHSSEMPGQHRERDYLFLWQ